MLSLTNGSVVVVDLQGNVVVPVAHMPAMNSPDAPWDPTNPGRFLLYE
jgi:hypothetical protein